MKKVLSLMGWVLVTVSVLTGCDRKENPVSTKGKEADIIGEPRLKIKRIGILLYDGFATLDAMGPHHVLSELMGTEVFFVAKESGGVTSSGGVTVQVPRSIREVDSLDLLIIPGGLQETYRAAEDTVLLNWIRKVDKTTTFTASVCTGAWILEGTGLLEGKSATTHWYGKELLRERGLTVKDQRWVQDGKYWTSAGVTAGMDMSLALINEIRGEKYTRAAMLDLEYDPRPPFVGGAEGNTDPNIVKTMRNMYDGAIKPVKNVATSKSSTAPEVDVVCGMNVSDGAADSAIYKGKSYSFCSKMCKVAFLKSPEIFHSDRSTRR